MYIVSIIIEQKKLLKNLFVPITYFIEPLYFEEIEIASLMVTENISYKSIIPLNIHGNVKGNKKRCSEQTKKPGTLIKTYTYWDTELL